MCKSNVCVCVLISINLKRFNRFLIRWPLKAFDTQYRVNVNLCYLRLMRNLKGLQGVLGDRVKPAIRSRLG